ncbi:MAG: HEAT repeat domain-containing protein, partial [Anaerolineae bacterium]
AAKRLTELGERTAMRPLMNAYMNYGDPEVLAALKTYGRDLTPAATRDAADLSIIGTRRARILDLLAATGDEVCVPAVRESVKDPDPEIHVRACSALARLDDLQGVDALAHDLRLTDITIRTLALAALRGLDHPTAAEAVASHVERYLAEAGAVPAAISVSAPRLDNREVSLTKYVAQHIASKPHGLTVVTGSEARAMATNRRDALEGALAGCTVSFCTRRMPPEEQIAELRSARDRAAADPSDRQVVLGALPGPHDSPPLPHFLTRPDDSAYSAMVLIVDPHECRLVMDWYRYVDDKAEVETDFEVVLGVSTPAASAISEEEYLINALTPKGQEDRFVRAYLAHL